MRGNSIQKYIRILRVTAAFFLLAVNFSFGQFYVSKASCIDNSSGNTGLTGGGCYPATSFFDTDLQSTTRIWNFGDTQAMTSNSDTARAPHHQYPAIGTYTITLTRTVGGVVQAPVTKTIKVGNPPTPPLFNKKNKTDTTVCDGKLKLNPYSGSIAPTGVTYLWFPKGETTPTIEVDSSGCYSVEVTTAEGCSKTAQITVKYCLQQAAKPNKKDVWYFGDKGSLEFAQVGTPNPTPKNPLANNGTLFSPTDSLYSYSAKPGPATNGNQLISPQAMAMVFGPQGNLVFYSNGKSILNSDNKPVPAVSPLTNKIGGDSTRTQSVIIVPKAACNECPHHQYYVFVQDSVTKMLTYSVIDMRTPDQKGIIVEKDVPVYYPISDRMTGVFTSDSTGFYIIAHSAVDNKFVVSKLDSTGLSVNVQSIGLSTNTPQSNTGYMRVSPSGDNIAIAISDGNKNYVQVYKLDKGVMVAPPLTINMPDAPPQVYGLEFSGSEERLYVTLKGVPNTGSPAARADSSFLYQLNLNLNNAAAIEAKKIKIDSSATESFGALQMGTDGRIYMAVNQAQNVSNQGILYDIQYPDALETNNKLTKGRLIGYDKGPIGGAVITGMSDWGLPNVIKAKSKNSDDGPSATFKNTCQNSPTIFDATPICSPMTNKYFWDFGDGTTKETDSKTVSHVYAKAGKYLVKMTIRTYTKLIQNSSINIPGLSSITTHCRDTTLQDTLYIRPTPSIHLPDSVYVCIAKGNSTTLDPQPTGGTGFTYEWRYNSPNNSVFNDSSTINVSAIGKYYVNVLNAEGCSADSLSKVLNGCEPEIYIPTAFTPNGDKTNDKLQVVAKFVTDFELRIFNRWGEQIFYTNTPDPDRNYYWDGKFNGVIMAPMNYAYVLQYKSQDFPKRPLEIKRGGILLVR